MARVLGRSLFFAISLAFFSPARADPILMFLVGMAKEIASIPAASQPAVMSPDLPQTYPGTTVPPEGLRRLIDESFTYLSAAQRAEVFEALNAELLKPANAMVRGPIIETFAARAFQVRTAQQQLEKLSPREMNALAADFQKEAKTLPEEDLAQLRQALEKNLLPVPVDLNRLLLIALD